MSGLVARRYQIVRSLGRGRLGEVFEVNDLQVAERVALKRWSRDLGRALARGGVEVRFAEADTDPWQQA